MKGRLNPIGLIRGRGRVYWRIFKALKTFFPMMRDWWRGAYRPLPRRAVMLMGVCVLYIVSPIDLIPDFLLGWGWLDDVIIGGWLLAKLDEELDDYRQWRQQKNTDSA
ncbi:YkvA family protein [Kushneria aurantia]|uniref:YkvA family protein n=1 Tax=Kushneria aurantia TaxID=504092 RepID=A0ABV6G6I3_9GAMM|nr:YkvA family protein [Kushneria aurantia]